MSLTRSEVDHIRGKAERDADTRDWRYWTDAHPNSDCWTDNDDTWLIQTIKGESTYAVGRSQDNGGHITVIVDDIDDREAVNILLWAFVNPGQAFHRLHQRDDTETQLTFGNA